MRVALVTGGTRGIGRAIALQLLSEQFKVAIVGTRSQEEITDLLGEFRKYQHFLYIQGNIGYKEDRMRIIDTVIKHFGRIDVLVNNAGVAPLQRLDILETTEENFDYVMSINLKGTFFLTQTAVNAMLKSINDNVSDYHPVIINISSISAYTSSPNRPEYCISKAGISMMTKLFADRLATYGIPVFEIRPGIMETDMTATVKEKYDKLIENGITPIKRWGTPQDVANLVSLLCSNKLTFSTGDVFNVDGGFHIQRL